jgi:HAD superfamily hydrolase (TIGR01549 family)
MTYDVIIFDSDGVLVNPTDTETVRSAVEAAFREAGVPAPAEEHVELFSSSVDVEALEEALGEYDLNLNAFWSIREEKSSKFQRELIRSGEKAPYSDVSLLEEFAETAELGVVSNNQQATIDFLVEQHGFDDNLSVVYGREMTLDGLRRVKPDPYYIEAALSGLDGDDALYVGDRESDILAAHNAGIDSALIVRPYGSTPALDERPTYRIRSFEDLLKDVLS